MLCVGNLVRKIDGRKHFSKYPSFPCVEIISYGAYVEIMYGKVKPYGITVLD